MSLLFRFWCFLFVLFLLDTTVSIDSDDEFNLLIEEVAELVTNGTVTHTELFTETKKIQENYIVCSMCNAIFKQAIRSRRKGASKESLLNSLKFLCSKFISERVCSGTLDLNAESIFYLVDRSTNINERKICGLLLQGVGCPSGGAYRWSVRLPSYNISLERIARNSSGQSFNVLQLSDIHYDPEYTPFGNADCNEPLCCQSDQGTPASVSSSCGYWTDYRDADSPWYLIEETIRQVNTQKFKYVYFTGDIISHKFWNTSASKNTEAISSLYSFFKEKFDVPVFPVFGNHEPHPVNLWVPRGITGSFSTRWLYKLAADFWSDLIGHNITETVLKGGYYSVSPEPGFRIVAINSNLCYTLNFWLMHDDSELKEQLQWLTDTLEEAENNNEHVHILSHIPPGTSECLLSWDREYSRIVERESRFSDVITGQFNGHSHWDEFRVFYSGTKATGVAFNGASLTPYNWCNPSYKTYEVDSATFSLRDYEEWTFDLNEANSRRGNTSVDWYKLYSFVEAYQVESLEPDQVDLVLYKMAQNNSLIQDYYRYKFREGDHMMKINCDENCEAQILCDITTTVFGDTSQCKRFWSLYGRSAGFRVGFDSFLIVSSFVFVQMFAM